ncbi:UPF0236 family transposase-like protein [Clostridium puniceum]|nr:UPF0236 family protein [Clostridium puniceum]
MFFENTLESIDDEIFNSRDKRIYRCKKKQKRNINTSFGSVTYKWDTI